MKIPQQEQRADENPEDTRPSPIIVVILDEFEHACSDKKDRPEAYCHIHVHKPHVSQKKHQSDRQEHKPGEQMPVGMTPAVSPPLHPRLPPALPALSFPFPSIGVHKLLLRSM